VTIKYDITLDFLKARCDIEIGGCWLWRESVNSHGQGYVRWGDKFCSVRRIVWEMVKGQPPKHALYATCLNKNCVNPACMRDVKHAKLRALCAKNGQTAKGKRLSDVFRSKPQNAKLTWEQAREIRRACIQADVDGIRIGKVTPVLCEKYGVCDATVRNIRANRVWREGILR
jgi:hypothetical protein